MSNEGHLWDYDKGMEKDAEEDEHEVMKRASKDYLALKRGFKKGKLRKATREGDAPMEIWRIALLEPTNNRRPKPALGMKDHQQHSEEVEKSVTCYVHS